MVWIIFFVIIALLLALDLGVFHKKDEVVSIKDSLKWTVVWVSLALLFGVAIYFIYENQWFGLNNHGLDGVHAMTQYYTGYVLEESLSLDNIFVIALIFKFFQIPAIYQHRILFWGIIGAVVFRLIMILLGKAFVENFSWSMYVFGGILLFSAFKMLKSDDDEGDFKDNVGVKLLSKIYPINWDVQDGKFFTVQNGKKYATGLLATLVVVEFTDILFAVDSIPAIFSITEDPFIIFSSNIFAILGLRNLYFFLSGMMDKFKHIKTALVFVLIFVGLKMIFHHQLEFLKDHSWVSLVVILVILGIGVLASIISNKKLENVNK